MLWAPMTLKGGETLDQSGAAALLIIPSVFTDRGPAAAATAAAGAVADGAAVHSLSHIPPGNLGGQPNPEPREHLATKSH